MAPRVSEKRKNQLLEARKARHNKDIVAPTPEELEQTKIGKAEKRAVAAEAEAAKLKKEVENYKKEAANARRRDERHKAAKEAWDREKQALKKDIEAVREARGTSNLAVQEGSIMGV